MSLIPSIVCRLETYNVTGRVLLMFATMCHFVKSYYLIYLCREVLENLLLVTVFCKEHVSLQPASCH
jgi:hypothetical protein